MLLISSIITLPLMQNKATYAPLFCLQKRKDMHNLRSGFLIIEILITVAMITLFTVICMHYQARCLTLQSQAVLTCELINYLENFLDAVKHHLPLKNISNSKYVVSHTVMPLTVPTLRGSPPNISCKSLERMKLLLATVRSIGTMSEKSFLLPIVFRKELTSGS